MNTSQSSVVVIDRGTLDREAWASAVRDRLAEALGPRSHREVGELTGYNPETVRRYRTLTGPSAHFLAMVCARYSVSPAWLCLGQGHRGPDRPPDDPQIVQLSNEIVTLRAVLEQIRQTAAAAGALVTKGADPAINDTVTVKQGTLALRARGGTQQIGNCDR